MEPIKATTLEGTPVIITGSKKFSLKAIDFLKGAILATVTPVLVIIQTSISEGSLIFDWKHIGMVALGTFVAYLGKNFFTQSSIQITEDTNQKNLTP